MNNNDIILFASASRNFNAACSELAAFESAGTQDVVKHAKLRAAHHTAHRTMFDAHAATC